MVVHLVDGTYELFRHFYAVPGVPSPVGIDVGAVRGVASSMLSMLDGGVTHLGVATDHVVESFRNELWPGYKTAAGIDPTLLAQFEPLEQVLTALGIRVWPMVEFEADDALASAAGTAARDPRVTRVFICTPDKDLAQSVEGTRVVQLDRRTGTVRDAAGVEARFGVPPSSIPDYLALVGDSADGYPGLPGWGQKSTATVLARYGHLEQIPEDAGTWTVSVRGAATLAATWREQSSRAFLFRDLATLRTNAAVFDSIDELRWTGPAPKASPICRRLGLGELEERAIRIAARRATGDRGRT